MDESEVLRFEQQKQITKLSQAIRESAKLRPNSNKTWTYNGCSCALAAAAEATGWKYQSNESMGPIVEHLDKALPNWGRYLGTHPAGRVSHLLTELGTREAVADYLEAEGL